ncbi:MAG TPA: hypothetical protein VFQ61_31180 [Polyangiaceae bacterium]|nr:hypothetical protein [Polyangiaceae bacterium]
MVKTTAAFAVLAIGSGALLAAAGLVETTLGVVLASPVWGAWGAWGATLVLTNELSTVVLGAFDDLVALVQRTAASGIHAAALKLAGTPTGIRVSALPEVFKRWRREALGDPTERGLPGRVAGWVGNWMLEGVQKRAIRQLGRDAQKQGATEVSLASLSSALPAIATSALTGPLRRSIALVRWASGAAMFCSLLVTALALFGASWVKR